MKTVKNDPKDLKLTRISYVIVLMISVFLFFPSCELIEDAEDELKHSEVIDGLRQALTYGADSSVAIASSVGGFMDNDAIRILLPIEAQDMMSFIDELKAHPELIVGSDLEYYLGFLTKDNYYTEFLEAFTYEMNHAAEVAVVKAKPIFQNAIKDLSITDGFAILEGEDNAATQHLRELTHASLIDAFHPEVVADLDGHNVEEAWTHFLDLYDECLWLQDHNELPAGIETVLHPVVNNQLHDFTTEHSIEGVFHLLAEEEKLIRNNPAEQVTDLLKNVFGN